MSDMAIYRLPGIIWRILSRPEGRNRKHRQVPNLACVVAGVNLSSQRKGVTPHLTVPRHNSSRHLLDFCEDIFFTVAVAPFPQKLPLRSSPKAETEQRDLVGDNSKSQQTSCAEESVSPRVLI
jgi:hypothetical protein